MMCSLASRLAGVGRLDKEDGSFNGPDVMDVHRGFERVELPILTEGEGFTGETIIISICGLGGKTGFSGHFDDSLKRS